MFCRNCGKKLSDNARFCDGCGASPQIEQSISQTNDSNGISLDSNVANINIEVSLQGFSSDLAVANGSYDPIDLGNIRAEEFYRILQKIKLLKAPAAIKANQDICSPVATVLTGDFIHAFEMMGGSILYSNSNTIVSDIEAINIVTGKHGSNANQTATSTDKSGKVHHSSRVWGSEHKDIKGLMPVRKHHIPPTNRVKTEAATIDIINSPQFHDFVIKSDTGTGIHKAPLTFSIATGVLGLGFIAVAEALFGVVCILATIFLIWLSRYLKKKSRGFFSLGFDWKSNVIWSTREGQKKPTYLGNANCITGIHIVKGEIKRSDMRNIGDNSTRIYAKVNYDYPIWDLMVEKTDGSNVSLCTFYTEEDAARVYNKALSLLNQQQ